MDPINQQIDSLSPVEAITVLSSLSEGLRQQLPAEEEVVQQDLIPDFLASVGHVCGLDSDAQGLVTMVRASEDDAGALSRRALHLLREQHVADEELRDLVLRPPDISQAPVEEMLLGAAALAGLVVILQLEFRARFSRGPAGTKVDVEVRRRPDTALPIALPALTTFLKSFLTQGEGKDS